MDLLFIINNILSFTLRLYADLVLPRNVVDIVINFLKTFITNILIISLKKDIIDALKKIILLIRLYTKLKLL